MQTIFESDSLKIQREECCQKITFLSILVLPSSEHPRCVSGKKKSTRQCKRQRFDPWGGKIPWRREWLPTPVFLPGESHRQRSLAGYSPWGHTESDTTECAHTHTHTHTHIHTHPFFTTYPSVRTNKLCSVRTKLLFVPHSSITHDPP